MTLIDRDALQFCELGLQLMWKGEIDSAIEHYDRASGLAESEETRDLITIRKAEALIASERDGKEIAALPMIVMRRRSPRHVYMASAVLMRRYTEADDRQRAIFYGEIAREAATDLDPFARATVLNHLGITLVADSQFDQAIAALDEALAAMAVLDCSLDEHRSLLAAIVGNLGGAKVLSGDYADGVRLLDMALDKLEDEYGTVEAWLDLCFAHLELGNYEEAERYGRRALESAEVKRQIRNANHLLGELCLRTERYDESDAFFDVVAGFYPDFKNVKQLLVAVDLSAVVNWKA